MEIVKNLKLARSQEGSTEEIGKIIINMLQSVRYYAHVEVIVMLSECMFVFTIYINCTTVLL